MGDYKELIATTWLKDLDDALLGDLALKLDLVQIAPGADLFAQGDIGDCMYLVSNGRLEVLIRDPDGGEWLVDFVEPGDFVGEMALLTGQKRTATLRVVEASTLLRLAKADFDELSVIYPELLPALGKYAGPRMQSTQLIEVLAGLFGVLKMASLHELRERLTWLPLPSGTTVSCLEEPPGSMYIVVNGRIRVDSITETGLEVPLAEAGSGDTIGEFNLLSGENRELKLLAIRDSNVVRLSQDVIESLLQENPDSVMKFVRRVTSGLKPASQIVREESVLATTVALLPISDGAPLAECSALLGRALETFGPTLHLSSESFDLRYGKEGAAQTSRQDNTNIPILHWLAEQEHVNRFVLYECDATWTNWTRRCLRQADRILLVGWSDDSPEPGELELGVTNEEYSAERELALMHPANTGLPSGTSAWLVQRDLKAYHHVRSSNFDDYGRLARRLIGKEVAFVLSGGGARGFAHAGVFKALRESGIPIDLIGGASMGSLIGGSLAQGDDYEQVLGHAEKYGSPQTLYDFTVPAVSFMASRKLTRMVTGIFEERRIEDLWRPFFCVSADLTDAQPIIHREGLVWEAVRGSLAIPGIFSPMMYGQDVVVDGGVMNNFPIDLMRDDAPSGWVIGVNVSPPREIGHDYNFEPGLSGTHVILSKMNPLGSNLKVPSIFSILTRSIEVKGIYQMALVADKADVIIRPSVGAWNYLDFRPAREIAEAGYEAAMSQMEEIVTAFKAKGFRLDK